MDGTINLDIPGINFVRIFHKITMPIDSDLEFEDGTEILYSTTNSVKSIIIPYNFEQPYNNTRFKVSHVDEFGLNFHTFVIELDYVKGTDIRTFEPLKTFGRSDMQIQHNLKHLNITNRKIDFMQGQKFKLVVNGGTACIVHTIRGNLAIAYSDIEYEENKENKLR